MEIIISSLFMILAVWVELLNQIQKHSMVLQGISEKIDGPVTLVNYEQKMALTEEFLYFSNHLNNKIPKVANGQHALQVMRILIEASEQLEKNENK
jgi:hypothetical protein